MLPKTNIKRSLRLHALENWELRSKFETRTTFLKIAPPHASTSNCVNDHITSNDQTSEQNLMCAEKKQQRPTFIQRVYFHLKYCEMPLTVIRGTCDWTFGPRCMRKLNFSMIFSQVFRSQFTLMNLSKYLSKVEIESLWSGFPSLKIHDGKIKAFQSVSPARSFEHGKFPNRNIKSSLFRSIRLCLDATTIVTQYLVAPCSLAGYWNTFPCTPRLVTVSELWAHRRFVLGARKYF